MHLSAGHDFAFNATYITRQTRRCWIDLFADYSARIAIVYLEPPLDRILDHNRSRRRVVPAGIIE